MRIFIDKYNDDVTCFDFKDGDVTGYKLTFNQLLELAKWYIDSEAIFDDTMAVSESKLAAVSYDGDKNYIEAWSLRYDEESGLFKYHDPWKYEDECFRNNSQYSEERLIEDIVNCFGYKTDNIVFNVKPEIVIYEGDEDE